MIAAVRPAEAILFVDRRVPITPLPIVIEHLGDEGRRLWLEATVRQDFRGLLTL